MDINTDTMVEEPQILDDLGQAWFYNESIQNIMCVGDDTLPISQRGYPCDNILHGMFILKKLGYIEKPGVELAALHVIARSLAPYEAGFRAMIIECSAQMGEWHCVETTYLPGHMLPLRSISEAGCLAHEAVKKADFNVQA